MFILWSKKTLHNIKALIGYKRREDSYVLIFSLLTLLLYYILFVFRSLDDNRLTSWQSVFSDVSQVKVFSILIGGIISAYMLSRVSFSIHNSMIFLFFSSYIISALFWREPEVIVDTARYFTSAKHLEVYGIGYFFKEWGRGISVWTDLPLMPFIYGMVFRVFGEERLYIQLFITSLFSMTVLLTYLIGKILWDEDVGLFGGILVLGIPYLFTQTGLMLSDVPTMFFLTLSIFAFIYALRKGGVWRIVFSAITIFLTFFSKYSTWLWLSVLIIIFLVHLISTQYTKNYVYRGSVIALISALLIGAVFLYKYNVFSEQVRLLISYQRPGLKRWGEGFISTFFFQIHPFITISALYSIYIAFKKKDIKYVIISYLPALVFLLQINRIRYSLVVFPMLTLMASYGIREIKGIGLKRFIIYSIVAFSLMIAIFGYLPFLQKISTVNLKDGGRYLNSLNTENIEVFTPSPTEPVVNPAISVCILDLFTRKTIYYDYNPVFPLGPEGLEKSSLRFTWEYKNPRYYVEGKPEVTEVVVVISEDVEDNLPLSLKEKLTSYHMAREFKTSNGLFSYNTIVKIYLLGKG